MAGGQRGKIERMILDSRYKNDDAAVLSLNEIQRSYIKQVKEKIQIGYYAFETVPCTICNGTSFETIANKDRYGFELNLAICVQCGLAQTNPRMNQESYDHFYNEEYRFIYGGEVGPTEVFFKDQYSRLGKKIYNFVTENSEGQSLKGKFVLEIGCGAGGILKYFKDQGCIVKGIDLGSQYIGYGKMVHGLDLQVMSIEKLQLDQKPDVIIYSHVLEHILDLKNQLNCLQSSMHDSTIVYIEVPGLKNLHRSYQGDLLLYLQNAHVYHFTKTSLLNLMESQGFKKLVIDEFVRSIFKKATPARKSHSFINEYASIMWYLKRIEWVRKISPVPPYLVKFYLKRGVYNLLAFLKVVPPLSKN